MKTFTDEEVIQKGHDPYIASACGNIDILKIYASEYHDEIALGYPIARDERVHELEARMEVPAALASLRFKCKPSQDLRVKPRFLDVMGLSSTTGDDPNHGGILLGIRTIISESARNKLAPYLKDECVFVPTEVEGAPEPYFILWVRTICDALDEERTTLIRDSVFLNKKRAVRPIFCFDKINATYLFRLPQWKYTTTTDCDLATKKFRELVSRLKIKGFQFRAGSMLGPLLS